MRFNGVEVSDGRHTAPTSSGRSRRDAVGATRLRLNRLTVPLAGELIFPKVILSRSFEARTQIMRGVHAGTPYINTGIDQMWNASMASQGIVTLSPDSDMVAGSA